MPEAGVVRGVCQEIPVIAYDVCAERHELLAFGKFIHINHYFFRCVQAAFFPAMDLILFACFRARVIVVAAFLVGDLDVGFLDAAEQFVVQLFL